MKTILAGRKGVWIHKRISGFSKLEARMRLKKGSVKRRNRMKRARKNGKHKQWEWWELVEKFEHRCVICWKKKPLQKDHIVPVRNPESSDAISNIQPVCGDCNLKRRESIRDWRPMRLNQLANKSPERHTVSATIAGHKWIGSLTESEIADAMNSISGFCLPEVEIERELNGQTCVVIVG